MYEVPSAQQVFKKCQLFSSSRRKGNATVPVKEGPKMEIESERENSDIRATRRGQPTITHTQIRTGKRLSGSCDGLHCVPPECVCRNPDPNAILLGDGPLGGNFF